MDGRRSVRPRFRFFPARRRTPGSVMLGIAYNIIIIIYYVRDSDGVYPRVPAVAAELRLFIRKSRFYGVFDFFHSAVRTPP